MPPQVRANTQEGNARQGTSRKTVQTDQGPVELDVPRDRAGSFAPTIIPKRQRRLEGFDDKVLALYAHGLTTREIQGHLEELYGTDGLAHADLDDDRCGLRGGTIVAESAVGGRVPHSLFCLALREVATRGSGEDQSRLCGFRRESHGGERTLRPVGE
jgi:hypothetical protein